MKKPKVAFIRGAFLNSWELQNYEPLRNQFNLVIFSSLKSFLSKESSFLPERQDHAAPGAEIKKLVSPMDLPNFPYKMAILNRLLIDAHWLFGLEEKLKGFEIAHVAETYYAYTHQALKAKRKGMVKKIISTCWEIIPHNNESIWGRREWKKQAIQEIDHFICPTEMAKRCLIEEGCRPEKISVVRMGVDLKKFKMQKSKIKRKIKNAKMNILYVGRLEKEKGVWELMEAFSELRKKQNNLFLTLVGEGKKLPERKKGVKLTGRLNYDKILKEYQKADVFVLPSKATKTWAEQYGMVLVEAMASGLPIIATKSGAIPEVLAEVGILVKPGDASALAKALNYLLAKPEKREEEGRRGRRRAQRYFDREKIAEKIAEIYQFITKKPILPS